MAAATDTGFAQMRVSKVVGLQEPEGDRFECIVLDEVRGDRHFVIQVGSMEAFSLAASLGGTGFGRPMTYQLTAALVQGLGGRIRQVRIDRLVAGAYAATVEVEGAGGIRQVDARPSDALNLAVLADAPIFAAHEVVEDSQRRQEGDSAEAALLRRARDLPPMTVRRAEA